MELTEFVHFLPASKKAPLKKKLLALFNKGLKESMTPTDMSYGEFQPGYIGIGINISNADLILKMKEIIEQLGFKFTANENDYNLFLDKAFADNKLAITCKNPVINKDYIIDANHVSFNLGCDPRNFNKRKDTGIHITIKFPLLGRTPKAMRHLKHITNAGKYGSYTGKTLHANNQSR